MESFPQVSWLTITIRNIYRLGATYLTESNALSITGSYRLAAETCNDRDGVQPIWLICLYPS